MMVPLRGRGGHKEREELAHAGRSEKAWQSLDSAKKGKGEEVPHRGTVPA